MTFALPLMLLNYCTEIYGFALDYEGRPSCFALSDDVILLLIELNIFFI